MSQINDKNGFLTEYGKFYFKTVIDLELEELLSSCKTEEELRIMGCAVSKRIGDLVADKVAKLKK